jgi:hypothetical protein
MAATGFPLTPSTSLALGSGPCMPALAVDFGYLAVAQKFVDSMTWNRKS